VTDEGAPPGQDDLGTKTDPGLSRGIPRTLAWLRRFAKIWGFALFCIFVVYVFRDVALPFLFAILIAYVLAPLVDRLASFKVAGRQVSRALAVLTLYVNMIGLLALVVVIFVPKLSGDFARLFREAPGLFQKLNEEWVPRAGAWVDHHLGADADAAGGDDVPAVPANPPGRWLVVEPMADGKQRISLENVTLEVKPTSDGGFVIHPQQLGDDSAAESGGRWERVLKNKLAEMVASSEDVSRRAFGLAQKLVGGVLNGIAKLFLVLMIAAFILIDLQRIRGFLRSLVPASYRGDYDRIAVGIDRGLAGVIRGQLIICLINGFLTFMGLLLFQVKYAFLLGLIAGVMSVVPIFGSILSSIPIVVVALISNDTFDPIKGLAVVGWISVIHLIEANFLNPKIMGDAARIHPVLVVFALIAGEHSYGLVGALFAVPVASIIQTIFSYYRRRRPLRAAAPA